MHGKAFIFTFCPLFLVKRLIVLRTAAFKFPSFFSFWDLKSFRRKLRKYGSERKKRPGLTKSLPQRLIGPY